MISKILKPFKRTPIMEFYCHPDSYGCIPEPQPASKSIPNWFKRIKPCTPEERDHMNLAALTVKKCMPVLDAMSLGYTIPLIGDLGIRSNEDCSEIQLTNPPIMKVAEFHAMHQIGGTSAPGYPAQPLKFINAWTIRTAPGWSTLFLPLVNDLENQLFTTFAALVDTDKYPKVVNFPAIWHKGNFDDYLPAGMPLVVAIPIQRSAVPKNPLITIQGRKESAEIERLSKCQQTRRDVYKNELRDKRK